MYYFNHGFGSKKRGLKKRNHESMPTTMTAVKAMRKNRTEPCYVSQFPAEEHQQERSKEVPSLSLHLICNPHNLTHGIL